MDGNIIYPISPISYLTISLYAILPTPFFIIYGFHELSYALLAVISMFITTVK